MTNTMLLTAVVFALSAGATAHADAAADPTPVVLSAADAAKPAALPVGATSTLRLESNPSTGYGWQVVETRNLRVDEPIPSNRPLHPARRWSACREQPSSASRRAAGDLRL